MFQTRPARRLVPFCASVVLMLAGCLTTASLRPEIEGMRSALVKAKSAGAETDAPEAYAHAEACLDWLTHEATEFDPMADPMARELVGKCRAGLQALDNRMLAAREAAIPVETVTPPLTPTPEQAPVRVEKQASPSAGVVEAPSLRDIFFDFDKTLIRSDARSILHANIQWLKAHPRAEIMIEGHCDERGTREYNLALGGRRAAVVKNYLVSAGVDAQRIRISSYGKERPFVLGHNESAWRWNRRARFVLTQ